MKTINESKKLFETDGIYKVPFESFSNCSENNRIKGFLLTNMIIEDMKSVEFLLLGLDKSKMSNRTLEGLADAALTISEAKMENMNMGKNDPRNKPPKKVKGREYDKNGVETKESRRKRNASMDDPADDIIPTPNPTKISVKEAKDSDIDEGLEMIKESDSYQEFKISQKIHMDADIAKFSDEELSEMDESTRATLMNSESILDEAYTDIRSNDNQERVIIWEYLSEIWESLAESKELDEGTNRLSGRTWEDNTAAFEYGYSQDEIDRKKEAEDDQKERMSDYLSYFKRTS